MSDIQVQSVGQAVLGIVAETKELARQARRHVKISYKPLPAILTLEVHLTCEIM